MSLSLDFQLPSRDVQVALEVADGEHLAILGPNGAGKSTVLQVLAGLLRPASGHAQLGDRTLFSTAGAGQWLPAHARGISMLAQQPLLFPHLSAAQNIAFGPRSSGASRREAARIADEWLHRLGLWELRDRKPSQLSGGQAQRMALARALAPQPQLLLLDEPMAALDVHVVPELRLTMRELLRGKTTVMVTHSAQDALVLADRVVVVEAGRIAEQGPAWQVLSRPASSFGRRMMAASGAADRGRRRPGRPQYRQAASGSTARLCPEPAEEQ
jgi:molybdate transport system ATP-binding protein